MSLWTRDVLLEILPWCKMHNVAFIPFSPLGRGFLSGKYISTDMFGKNDLRSYNPRFQAEALQTNLEIVKQINQIAQRHNATNA
jgi:aryl-alcohol dehydrogenase-like predicted oxidoreductase